MELDFEGRPIAIRSSFIEDNVRGIKYERKSPEEKYIWDTERSGLLMEPEDVFDGVRTPYFKIKE